MKKKIAICSPSDMSVLQAYTSQYIALMLMALQLSEDRISFTERRNQIIDGLRALPAQIKSVLENDKSLRELANSVLANSRSLLLMGRGYQSVVLVHDLNRKIDRWFLSGMPLALRAPSRSRKLATCIQRVSLQESLSTVPWL